MKKSYQIQSLPRMFEQVAKQIVDYIHNENLEAGTKLPTERNLSELLQVSRSSVREGIRVLELLKYLESRQGEGTFVSDPPPYLLPLKELNQEIVKNQLDHYYEVALMTAERILSISMDLNIFYNKPLEQRLFWKSLISLISTLGEQLENPHYAALWSETIQLLIDHDYFEEKVVDIDIQTLLAYYEQKDKDELRQLFHKLSK